MKPVASETILTALRRTALASAFLLGNVLFLPHVHALTFAEAVDIAQQQNPLITGAQKQVESTQFAQKAAGALPDPTLSVGLENLPVNGPNAWSTTGEPMTTKTIALGQDVPNRAKRNAQIASAQASVAQSRAALVVQRLQVKQELTLAWIAAQAVDRKEKVLDQLVAENRRQQASLPARVTGGSAWPGDYLAAQQDALALDDRRDDLERDRIKARAALMRWVGSRANETLQGDPQPLAHTVAQLRANLADHAEVRQYAALNDMAQAQSHEAESEARGDWGWEVAYGLRDRSYGHLISVRFKFQLPWQQSRLQTPLTNAKLKEMERVQAQQEDVERQHLQALDEDQAEMQALDRQIARLQSRGQDLARQRADLALSDYGSAVIKGQDLSAVFGTRAQALEVQWRLIDLQAQRDSVIARLNGFIADNDANNTDKGVAP